MVTVLKCYHGSHTNGVQICAKFHAHTYHHHQEIHNGYYCYHGNHRGRLYMSTKYSIMYRLDAEARCLRKIET